MRIEKAKEEQHSTTIIAANWIARISVGFVAGNAICAGLAIATPEWYESKLSRFVNGINATAFALGVPGAAVIKQGRRNAGGLQQRGRSPVFLDRVIPESPEELELIRRAVRTVDRVKLTPEEIEEKVGKAGQMEAEIRVQVAEKTSAIAKLGETQRELRNKEQEVESLKGTPPIPMQPEPVEEEDDSLFDVAVKAGRLIDAVS